MVPSPTTSRTRDVKRAVRANRCQLDINLSDYTQKIPPPKHAAAEDKNIPALCCHEHVYTAILRLIIAVSVRRIQSTFGITIENGIGIRNVTEATVVDSVRAAAEDSRTLSEDSEVEAEYDGCQHDGYDDAGDGHTTRGFAQLDRLLAIAGRRGTGYSCLQQSS
jgi:hypothetical protein